VPYGYTSLPVLRKRSDVKTYEMAVGKGFGAERPLCMRRFGCFRGEWGFVGSLSERAAGVSGCI